jgi:hypothetical protein
VTDYYGECRPGPTSAASDFRITTVSTDWLGTSSLINPNFGDYTDNATKLNDHVLHLVRRSARDPAAFRRPPLRERCSRPGPGTARPGPARAAAGVAFGRLATNRA